MPLPETIIVDPPLDSLGYAQLLSITNATAVSLPAIPSGATFVVISVKGGPVRMRDDGTAPTPTLGMVVAPGQVLSLSSQNVAAIQFIAKTTYNANLDITYYRVRV